MCVRKTASGPLGKLDVLSPKTSMQMEVPPFEDVFPIGSMYGIFTYIYHKMKPNVGKYTIHGSFGFNI